MCGKEGECNLPCSLGRWSARFPTLEQGKPKLSALKRGEEIRVFHEKNREGGGDFAFSSI
ncbi:hypothetical protein T4D_7431 [Trichinella pseudospiralis]|uniref:Uncharacterized protein n=1 Tax=Trichinella pseudospiralis TaxID=6337 RepID=A0A0V1EF25_TRIPS|nr:hypothetical protein T4D_7431 [Trichinella pseudospiralis]